MFLRQAGQTLPLPAINEKASPNGPNRTPSPNHKQPLPPRLDATTAAAMPQTIQMRIANSIGSIVPDKRADQRRKLGRKNANERFHDSRRRGTGVSAADRSYPITRFFSGPGSFKCFANAAGRATSSTLNHHPVEFGYAFRVARRTLLFWMASRDRMACSTNTFLPRKTDSFTSMFSRVLDIVPPLARIFGNFPIVQEGGRKLAISTTIRINRQITKPTGPGCRNIRLSRPHRLYFQSGGKH
jgi:hypothetical protein